MTIGVPGRARALGTDSPAVRPRAIRAFHPARLIVPLLVVGGTALAETSFDAVWRRGALPDKGGVLVVGEAGIAFRPAGEGGRERSWTFRDIQHFERIGQADIEILSYADSFWKLGRDRRYRFSLREAELGDELLERVVDAIGKPATDRLVRAPPVVEHEIPVKRLKRLGGSEGTLLFASDRIVYSSPSAGQSRTWMLGRDVATVWSSDPFRLEVHVHDGTGRFVRRPTVFRFALKRRLEADFYRALKERLYALDRRRPIVP